MSELRQAGIMTDESVIPGISNIEEVGGGQVEQVGEVRCPCRRTPKWPSVSSLRIKGGTPTSISERGGGTDAAASFTNKPILDR